jgi:hypothetical protein
VHVHNLINKFEAETSAQDDAGVVAIEYLLVASVVIAAFTAAAFTGALDSVGTKLSGLVTGI